MKTIINLTLLFLLLNINSFAKNIEALEIDELESYMQKNVIIIDIREKKKWKNTGVIPGSYRLTYNNTVKNNNEKKWQYILIRILKQKNRTFVLISKDGKKAEKLARKLFKEKKFKNAMFLKGGIKSWLDADRRVINY